jgi:polysaccharide deacetylase family protein (PEP-CTERM system associated)
MLDSAGVKATFFTLGWIAERHPQLVRDIVAAGHELASHGYGHERASDMSPTAFSDDVRRAKALLEDLGGVAVTGYRAPSFSIGVDNLWAFDVLAEAGYRYSSSVYPIQHDHYGMPDSPRWAHAVRAGLLEVPVTTCRIRERNWPSSGGGYFRLLPYGVSRWLIERVNREDRQSAVFYFHPWEIDPGQPVVDRLSKLSRFRHYRNLHCCYQRLEKLFDTFHFGSLELPKPQGSYSLSG